MLGNAGHCRHMPRECTGVGEKCERNTGDARGTYSSSGYRGPGNARECRGMPGERMGVGVICQGNAGNAENAGECQGNVWKVYSARGMQGTTRGMQGSWCKVLAERGMQGNVRGTYESGGKVPGECRGM